MQPKSTSQKVKSGDFSYAGDSNKLKIEEYQKAMFKIREATGVSDVNEVIAKFASQADTHENLQDLKFNNERKLIGLTDKR